jgi:hypothetical protein
MFYQQQQMIALYLDIQYKKYHLGRNLYRSFITVIGEAISNSWDADAENVWRKVCSNAPSRIDIALS